MMVDKKVGSRYNYKVENILVSEVISQNLVLRQL